MATINLGRVKPVFRGAYAGGTAYVVDDIVTSGNETFICIQASTGNATSNASYWTKLAAKGTDGTDVGTTITTQGDILYRSGSGLARLGAGTSGHFLKTQGTGANPVWAEAGGGLVQTVFASSNTGYSNGSSSYTSMVEASITPSSASNNIIVLANTTGYYNNNNSNGTDRNHYFRIARDAGSDVEIISAEQRSDMSTSSFRVDNTSMFDKDNPNTTSAVTYKFQMKGQGGGWDYYTNHNSTHGSQIILMEVKV